jgi:hypothetical protein
MGFCFVSGKILCSLRHPFIYSESGKEEGVEVVVTKFCQIFYLSCSSLIMGFYFVSGKYFAHSVIHLFTATRAAARKSCHFTQLATIFTTAVHGNP